MPNETRAKNSFVQLQVQDRLSASPWCELILANGQKLLIHQPVPADLIKSLLDLACCIRRLTPAKLEKTTGQVVGCSVASGGLANQENTILNGICRFGL